MSIAAAARERFANVFGQSVFDNPVLMMGFRTRMRRATGFLVMGAYVLFLTVVLLITWYVSWESPFSGNSAGTNPAIGQLLFHYMTATQAWLFLLIVPALTSGALTQELERRTMELLALTPLTPGKIILGKSLSAFLYCVALLVCSVPLGGMCLMLGGISPSEIAVTYAALGAWALLLAAVGVFWSSLFRSTAASVLFTYGSCGLYMFVNYAWTTQVLMTMHYGWGWGVMGSSMTGSNVFVLMGLYPARAAFTSMMTAKVCGLNVPVALVAFLLHAALAALLLFVATVHVRYHRTEKALPVRLLLLAISLGLIWILVGNSLSFSPVTGKTALEALEIIASLILVLLCLATPIFTTGPLNKSPETPVMAYALSLKKILRNDLGGGLPFVLFWSFAAYAVFGVTFWWTQIVQPSTPDPMFWTNYFRIGAAILAIVAGIGSVGALMSCVMQSRRNALAMTFLFLLIVFGGYLIALIYYMWGPYYSSGMEHRQSVFYQFAAFWPMTPLLSPYTWQGPDMPKLWWEAGRSWLVTGAMYVATAALALLLATPAARKWGGVQEE
ncbi:MAG: ABC transporter permease subunit [Armatimonadota bacterium]|nr:ABC transporter permease subunit [Armatimonadota bacterium]